MWRRHLAHVAPPRHGTIDDLNSNFSVPVSIRSALNAKNQNINVFVTVVEDSIVASQSNNLYSSTDPAL